MGFSIFTDLVTPTKYKIPEAATVDIKAEQIANNEANLASFESAKGLAQSFNDFQQAEYSKRLRQVMPEFEGLQSQASANFADQLAGKLSLGDAAASQRTSAARTLGLGTFGSPAGGALVARDLGLKQFQLQQNAQAQLPNYLAAITGIKKAPLFDFSNSFLTAGQRIQAQFENKSREWNVQNLKNQMKVQPEPWAKALAGFGDSILDAVASYYTMGASGMANGIGQGAGSRGKNSGFNVGDAQQQIGMERESGLLNGSNGMSNGDWGLFTSDYAYV